VLCSEHQAGQVRLNDFKVVPEQALAGTEQRWTVHPRMEEMKAAARAQGLWNLWVSPDLAARIRPALPEKLESEDRLLLGAGLSNLVRAAHHGIEQRFCVLAAFWHSLPGLHG
jgi:hypothetical protein